MTAALLVLVFLGAWEIYARSGAVDDLILPAPTQIADAIAATTGCCGTTSS